MRKRNTNAAILLVCLLSELSEGAFFERRMSVYFGARFASRLAAPLYLFYTLRSFGLISPSIHSQSRASSSCDDGSDVMENG
jgi:hypothetical protein